MKIDFEDKSYIEIKMNDNKVVVIISAKDNANVNRKIMNAVEITLEQFKSLIGDIKL
jgi:hypothetical protein